MYLNLLRHPKRKFRNDSIRSIASCLLSLFCLTAFVGCGNSERQKLVGSWQLDNQSKVEKRISSDDPEAKKEAQSDGDEPGDSKMTIEFRGNGELFTKTKMGAIDGGKQGNWKFIEFNTDQNVMKVECTIGLQKTQHEVVFESEDSIMMVPPNMAGVEMKLRFTRN